MSQQESVGLLVLTVRKRIKQVTSVLLREEGLSPQQFWTMVVISRADGLSLGELAARRRMDEPTASRVVNLLVQRRLVRRSSDPVDRRRSRLVLTPAGREIGDRLLPLADTIVNAVEGALTPGERNAVVSGLQKIVSGLDQFQQTQAGRELPAAKAVS